MIFELLENVTIKKPLQLSKPIYMAISIDIMEIH